MLIKRVLGFVALLVALAAPRPGRAAVARPIHEGRLTNGLRFAIAPDPAGGDVSVVVTYRTGSRDEPAGLDGLAHLVEHLLWLESKHVPRGGYLRLLEQAGATQVNAITSFDTTTYFETMPPERLDLALWLESERMAFAAPTFTGETLDAARAEVLNEHRERVLQHAVGTMDGVRLGELFPEWHPYHHPPIGSPQTIRHASVADARAFVNTWYVPTNAIVVIAGKVDPQAGAALVQRYFGSLPARPPPARPSVPHVSTKGTTVVHLGAGVTREVMGLAWATPRFGTDEDLALDLASAVLVDRGAGWLERTLIGKRELCTRVAVLQRSMELASVFEIYAVVAERKPMRDALAAIQDALASFAATVTDEEIQRSRLAFQMSKLFRLESSMGLAQQLATLARLGPLPAVYDGQMARFAGVSPQAVREAMRAWVGPKPWVAAFAHAARRDPFEGVVWSREFHPW
jgi:zinc protease